MIDSLLGSDNVPPIKAFDWLKMAEWRTRPVVKAGELGVELNRNGSAEASHRFAPFPPKLVLAVDNGVVVFEDGRRVPQDRAEAYLGA